MALIFTFLLVAALEIAHANHDSKEPAQKDTPEEPDMCVGCDDKKKDKEPDQPPVTIEIRIDPETGKVQYIIKNIAIEQ